MATATLKGANLIPITSKSAIEELSASLERYLKVDGHVWEEDPVDFKTFVESKDFCGLSLSEKQYECLGKIVGGDPKKFFSHERQIREVVLALGKGAGKDFMCSILQTYAVYVLLCLRDPQGYFHFPSGESLDCINVARSKDQARNVYFKKLTARLLENKWFRDNYTVIVDGRKLSFPEGKVDRGQITLLSGMIQFPKNIRAISEHSANESFEGYNLILWIMDEASAFKSKMGKENAEPVYQTLTTSTRELPYVGAIISYPRHEDDFTIRKYEYSQSPEGSKFMTGMKAATWEVKPSRFYSGETFKFEVHPGVFVDIPIEYKGQFGRNPEDCKMKYMCIPPKAESPYFEYQEHIDLAVVKRDPIILVEDELIEVGKTRYVVKRILGLNLSSEEARLERMIWVDNGETSCRATLSIGRKITKPITKLIIEQTLVWYPDVSRGIQVSLKNLEEVLVWLCDNLNVKVVGWDYWNSATAKESVEAMRVETSRKNLSEKDYATFKGLIYTGMVEIPDLPDGINELKKLGKREDGGVTKRSGNFKDIADSWVGCGFLAFGDKSVIVGDLGRVFPAAVTGVGLQGSGEASQIFGTAQRVAAETQLKDAMTLEAGLERLRHQSGAVTRPSMMGTVDGKPHKRSAFPKTIRMIG